MALALKQRWSGASRRTKGAVVGGSVVAAALVAGGAYALWSASGVGEGRAGATNAVVVDVIAADGTPDLFPGVTDGDIHFTLDNANPYAVDFTSATAGAVTSSDEAACPAANVTVGAIPAIDLTVGAAVESAPLSIADVVTMSIDAPDGCQGVSFDIALTLTGTQANP